MLYFVFNPDVIAVLVAHNIEQGVCPLPLCPSAPLPNTGSTWALSLLSFPRGVWNLQLPFYPPHQTPDEFTPQLLERVLTACTGSNLGPGGLEWELHSANPWRMNAQVAHRFSHGTPPHVHACVLHMARTDGESRVLCVYTD